MEYRVSRYRYAELRELTVYSDRLAIDNLVELLQNMCRDDEILEVYGYTESKYVVLDINGFEWPVPKPSTLSKGMYTLIFGHGHCRNIELYTVVIRRPTEIFLGIPRELQLEREVKLYIHVLSKSDDEARKG